MGDVANPTVWAEYGGFAGLVALALFVLVFWMLREHKHERTEWRSDVSKQSERSSAALEKLTEVIRDNHK